MVGYPFVLLCRLVIRYVHTCMCSVLWLSSVVVRALDLQSAGRGFKPLPLHCCPTTVCKLLTHAPGVREVTTIWCCKILINLIEIFFFFHFELSRGWEGIRYQPHSKPYGRGPGTGKFLCPPSPRCDTHTR